MTNTAQRKTQEEIIEKILQIVAKNNTVERIAKMVKINSSIHQCKRRANEPVKGYVLRFQTPSLHYLNLIQAGKSSPLGQTVALKMINNENLPSQSFSNILSAIINKLMSQESDKIPEIRMRRDRLDRIIENLKMAIHQAPIPEEVNQDIAAEEAAISAKTGTETSADEGHIYLKDAIEALEAAFLNQDDILISAQKTTIQALMATHNKKPTILRRVDTSDDTEHITDTLQDGGARRNEITQKGMGKIRDETAILRRSREESAKNRKQHRKRGVFASGFGTDTSRSELHNRRRKYHIHGWSLLQTYLL